MHKSLIRRLFVGCVAMMLLIVCSPVASASGNLNSDNPSKAEIQAMWQKVTSASAVFDEEPSVVSPYAAGKLTAEFLETGLTYTNYVRFVANLPLVQLDDTYNEDAQHGAVVLAANDTLSHHPEQPAGMDEAFYERACDATSSSNIFYCYGYSPLDTLKVAVGGFMDDDDSSNNDRLGHRRWILNPKLKSIGFGYAQSQSGSNYAVMKVFDRSGDAVNYDYIAWPAAGNFPTNLFASTVPWSITLNPSCYQTPELSQLKIVLTRKSDGTAFTFTESTGAPGSPANAFLNVDTAGYGVSNCIIFNPGSSNISSYSGVYTVDVSGIYTSDGSAATLHYEVDFFDVNNVCTSHDYLTEETPATCTTPGSIVKTCKNCGESITETTAALGHNYVDGTCTRCQEADPDYVAPDDGLSGTCGENLTWEFDEETGTLTISGTGEMYNYTLEAEGNPAPWFDLDCSQVIISEGITSLGKYSFYWCKMNEISLPSSLVSIGDFAFYCCANLSSVSIPTNVSNIGGGAFIECPSMGSFWVELDNQHFSNDGYGVLFDKEKTTLIQVPARLTNAYSIPDSVKHIGKHAFFGCNHITDIYIPDNVEDIGDSAFYSCTMLTELTLPSKLTKLNTLLFSLCENLTRVDIPNGVTEFETGVFHGCENLQELIIPKAVTRLGERVFGGCSKLEHIIFKGNAPTFTDTTTSPTYCDGTFKNVQTTVYYPGNNPTWTSDVMQDYGGDITWVAYNDEFSISGTCGENLIWLFDEDTETLTISGTGEMDDFGYDSNGEYTNPGWYTYSDMIKTVVIGENVTSIGADAFAHFTNLTEITIPEKVSKIGIGAFIDCVSLSEIKVSADNDYYVAADGVLFTKDFSTLHTYPAGKMDTSYTVPDGVLQIEDWAFFSNEYIHSIIISDDVRSVGKYSFDGCINLQEIMLSANLTSIGMYAFCYCEQLNSIIIPAKVANIDRGAFYWCISLTDIYFEGNAPEIYNNPDPNDENTFSGVTAVAHYPANNPTWTTDVMKNYGGTITWTSNNGESTYYGTCGDDLTWNFNETSGKLSVSGSGDMYGADKLGWTAFAGDIRSVEIGSGATSVGAYAFSDCTNLADVQMPDTVMNIAYNAFENCSSLKTVDIPENVMDISYGAFMDCTGLASVELPQNVMSISYHAFDNCTSLAAVDFPASLSSIQDEAFGSCSGLDELRFTGNAPEIQSNAFLKVTADAYYPASNTTWTEAVRQNYGGTLTWIAEGGTVTPDNSCGENITWSFEEATGTLTISGTEPMARSNGNSVMDDYARPEDTPWFEYQDQIITVVIEATVDSVGKNAFAGCSNLTTVIIEEGVSEIDATAFSDCQSLENCYFEGTKEQWEDLGADVGEVPVHTESAEPETHVETKTTVAPTCTEQGYDLYTCSCGTIRKDNFKDPTGHSYTAAVTEPTCTEKGFTTYTCTCGDSYTADEVAALGHSWDEGTVIKEPTKEETGTRKYTCTVCEETMEETIAKLGAVQRISGSSRVKTALSVAAALKDTLGVEKFDAVIIAAGDNEKFADALAGSYLANVKGAPILLYTASGMSDLNVQFIQENLNEDGTIYLLGGANSIPDAATEKLADYKVERIAGSSRYTTNLAILKMAGVGNKEILVATGKSFADSLSISAAGLPILLIDGNASALRAEQIEFLEGLKGNKVTIIGGNNSVSVEMEDAIEKVISAEVDRISGNSRQMTSVVFAERYFDAPELAMITYSDNFPDGLAGGPLAYAMGAPLLLTKEGKEAAAAEYIAENGIASGYVLGGTSSISDATARKVFGLSDEAVITVK